MGLTAFNLRQYDARLGRWQTPDPYGQHHSPYLAMSNNPVSFTDPDGGYDWTANMTPEQLNEWERREARFEKVWEKAEEWGRDERAKYSGWYGQGDGLEADGSYRMMDGMIAVVRFMQDHQDDESISRQVFDSRKNEWGAYKKSDSEFEVPEGMGYGEKRNKGFETILTWVSLYNLGKHIHSYEALDEWPEQEWMSASWYLPTEKMPAPLITGTAPVPGFGGLGNLARLSQLAKNKAAGQVGEKILRATYGGRSNVYFKTSKGKRFKDNLADAIGRESKVGRTSLTRFVRSQVDKDVELMLSPTSGVRSVEWHFFKGETGIGPTKALREYLEKVNIQVIIHY